MQTLFLRLLALPEERALLFSEAAVWWELCLLQCSDVDIENVKLAVDNGCVPEVINSS